MIFSSKEKLGIVLSAPVQGEAGGMGVWGIPPAEPREFRSDIFKQTPPEFEIQKKTARVLRAVHRDSRSVTFKTCRIAYICSLLKRTVTGQVISRTDRYASLHRFTNTLFVLV